MAVTPSFWEGRRVFLTGHTGFKGGWLAIWLSELGAKVSGYALAPATDPNLFDLSNIERDMVANTIADIRDLESLRRAMHGCDPEIVFHMAAQPLVREGYADPVGTYETNMMGTVHVLECARSLSNIRAVIVVTTDKCYENKEWHWGYREIDRLGGRDPYSNSKACAELAADAYRQSFFRSTMTAVATVRAGNVIGGGDWSANRLVPDILRGCFSASGEVRLRNPEAVRPWQHVLEPLRGYALLAERLVSQEPGYDESWNFGPNPGDGRTVFDTAQAIVALLGKGKLVVDRDSGAPHEAMLLHLDCAKAKAKLGWTPKYHFAEAIAATSAWYEAWRSGKDMRAFTRAQIRDYAAFEADSVK